ncbi:DUF637 domain-containing protein, partial [Pseudomonas syringae group genomosp. 3]
EAELRGDVDWRQVKEVHDSLIGTAVNAAVVAGLTSATSQAVISTVNNKGNLGAALKDVTSAESMKGYLVSGLAAGFAAGILDPAYGVSPENTAKATHGFDLGSVDGFTNYAGYTLAQGGFSAAANTAINGGSLTDNLAQAAISSAADAMSAGIYNKLGTKLEFSGLPSKLAAHALVGGLIAELAGGDFRSGALAAGANEAFVNLVGDKIFVGESHDKLLAMTSQLVGLTVAAAAGGTDKDQAVAGWVAQQATTFNYLEHSEKEAFIKEMLGCDTDKCAREKWEQGKFDEDSQANVQYANDIAGSQRARETRDRVLDSLGSILDMNCPTSACEGYKQLLVKRSLSTLENMNQVIKDWASVDQRLGLMAGAAVGGKPTTNAALQPAEALALTRVQKAVDYLQGAKGINTPPAPRNANSLAGGPLENADQISGRFKLDGGPVNGTLYRADNQGNITSYAVYDSAGMIVKRVDVTGAAHANVSTPHVIEYGRNQLPDGAIGVQSPSTKLAPRPATSDEIP